MGGPVHNSVVMDKKVEHASTGNTTAVVVALPAPLDPIRLVGDEDKHATILFFGEISSLPEGAKNEITKTLARAAKTLVPFSEEILNITRLGSDDPPALVSMLSGSNLNQIRNILQVNPKIQEFLSNAQQFSTYTPHVTLAYPDIKGEMDIRQKVSPIYKISFDRLSLWWGDEQIEYPMGSFGTESVAHNSVGQEAIDNFLSHHGVKGMKWGVHRVPATGYQERAHSAAVKELNKTGFRKLNQLPKYAGKDISKNARLRKSYERDAEHLFDEVYSAHLYKQQNRLERNNRIRTVAAISLVGAAARVAVYTGIIAMADTNETTKQYFFKLNLNSLGQIETIEEVENDLMHFDDTLEGVLAHHGIKGMKWGVRRTSAQLARAAGRGAAKTATKIKENRAAKKEANRSSSSSGKPKHLSDQELQALVSRMRLEQDFKRLVAETRPNPKADGLIKSIIKENSKRQLQRIARSAADIAIEKALAKAGAPKGKRVLDTSTKEFSRDLAKALEKARTKK